MNTEAILGKIVEIAVEYGPKLLGAIAVWIIGGLTIKKTVGF